MCLRSTPHILMESSWENVHVPASHWGHASQTCESGCRCCSSEKNTWESHTHADLIFYCDILLHAPCIQALQKHTLTLTIILGLIFKSQKQIMSHKTNALARSALAS